MIVLASRSPQRRALLGSLGVDFRVVVADVDEGPDPQVNARAKARAVAARAGIPRGGAVLGCDTEVLCDGAALGKPADAEAALAMLRSLAGREHAVQSAVALVTADRLRERVSTTTVRMRVRDDALLSWYVGTGEWRERAGGYAIQGAGAALVEGIAGDHSNVVGLPLGAVVDLLHEAGLAPWHAAAAEPQ